MATRFYLPASGAAAVSPSFDAGWGSTTGMVSRRTTTFKQSTTIASTTLASALSSGRQGVVQYVSDPIVGQTIAVGTFKGTVRCLESATNDNIVQIVCSVRVVSRDGATVRGNIAAIGTYGPSNEWSATTLTNRRIADGDATSAVTAFDGDRIVIELGYLDAAGASISGSMSLGDSSATDCADNETATTANNAFLELSQTVTFQILHVQSTAIFTAASGTSTRTLTPTAGNLLIAVAWEVSGTAPTISDTQSLVWTVLNPATSTGGNIAKSWWAIPTASSSMTVTIVSGNGVSGVSELFVTEISGADKISPVDIHSEATGSGNPATSNATTHNIDQLWFGWAADSVTAVTLPWIKAGDDTQGDWSEWQIVGATSTTAAAALTGSGTYICFFAAFNAANDSANLAAQQQFPPPLVEGVKAAAY